MVINQVREDPVNDSRHDLLLDCSFYGHIRSGVLGRPFGDLRTFQTANLTLKRRAILRHPSGMRAEMLMRVLKKNNLAFCQGRV